jgi:hypothetical protein
VGAGQQREGCKNEPGVAKELAAPRFGRDQCPAVVVGGRAGQCLSVPVSVLAAGSAEIFVRDMAYSISM